MGSKTGRKTLCIAAGLLVLASCNEKFDNVLQEDYENTGTDYEQGKVLLIMVDGAAGKAVREAVNTNRAPHIRRYLDNAMYTFEGLADSRANLPKISNDRGWANLLTGVTTHGVGDDKESFEEVTEPTFLSLLKTSQKELSSALFSGDQKIVSKLGQEMDEAQLLQNDAEVTQSVVDYLAAEEEAPDVLIAQLNGVQKEGAANGFYEEDSDLVKDNILTAIEETDIQIGEIINSLKERPKFGKENWLVIVTSNYGGEYEGEKSEDFYDDPERNTFTMFYSPRLQSSLEQRPEADELQYSFFTPYFSGRGQASLSASVIDPTLFDMGSRSIDKNSYTVQFHVRDEYHQTTGQTADGRHSIVGKRDRQDGGNGWQIRYAIGGNNGRLQFRSPFGDPVTNDQVFRGQNTPWHTVTLVFKELGDDRYSDSLFMYVDGVLQNEIRRMDNNVELSSDKPLTIGMLEGGDTNDRARFTVTDLQFYNIALPPEYIAANYCKIRLDEIEDFPFRENLLGYWPNDREEDYGGNRIRDYSIYGSVYGGENAGKSDMLFENTAFWTPGSTADGNICPDPDASYFSTVFNTVDVPFQIMHWLGIPIERQWEWEGTGWPNQYRMMTDD